MTYSLVTSMSLHFGIKLPLKVRGNHIHTSGLGLSVSSGLVSFIWGWVLPSAHWHLHPPAAKQCYSTY